MPALEYVEIAIAVLLIGYVIYRTAMEIGISQYNPLVPLKGLNAEEQAILKKTFVMYGRLPEAYRRKCDERIVWFRSKKSFVFYGKIHHTDELRLILSATAAFMLLGLRNYKMHRSLFRVIVYPSSYYSRVNRRYHLGEYNPKFKTLVLSADKIREGFDVPDDNKNLAVHEFAHALSYEMRKKRSWEARRFRVGMRKIRGLFEKRSFRQKLLSTQYFRQYGLTNLHEFFSVAVENYFETPSIFHQDFPELFDIIQRMLNFDYEISCVFDPPRT
ncbi:MAG: zinc-dependent peptidase [Maribacter sp.]